MCYRTKLTAKPSEIEKTFDSSFIDASEYNPQEEINGFGHYKTPVITDENAGEIQLFNWGLIPFWAKDDKIKRMTLNARIETAEEKPAYRSVVKNRCLIIADGYYEWQWLDPKGKEKQKFLIKPKDQDIFAFAGIYSSWTNPATDELVNSYSIITTEANELMSEIHNNKKRMPVVLKPKDHRAWLNKTDLNEFAFPYDVQLQATEV